MPPIHRSPKKRMDTTQIYNLIGRVLIKTMKRTKRESGKLPGSTHSSTNVAKTFLALVEKHFPKNKRLSKIFNRNTIKVSYSCLPNVKQTISNNNHRLLQLYRMKESNQDSNLCNCRQKNNSCPLDGKCLTKCVVYKATVTETTSNNQETYIGLTENEFKTRFCISHLSN